MAKQGKIYIDAAKIEAILIAASMSYEPQAGFVKVSGPKGRNLYVAKTKRVARVDVSGFEVDSKEFGVTNLGGESFGAVKQQLNFDQLEGESVEDGEKRILGNFQKLCEHMKTLSERIPEKKGTAKAGEKKEKAAGWSGGAQKGSKPEGQMKGSTTTEVEGPKKDKHSKALSEITDLGEKLERLNKIKKANEDKKLKVPQKILDQIDELEGQIAAAKDSAKEKGLIKDEEPTEENTAPVQASA